MPGGFLSFLKIKGKKFFCADKALDFIPRKFHHRHPENLLSQKVFCGLSLMSLHCQQKGFLINFANKSSQAADV